MALTDENVAPPKSKDKKAQKMGLGEFLTDTSMSIERMMYDSNIYILILMIRKLLAHGLMKWRMLQCHVSYRVALRSKSC